MVILRSILRRTSTIIAYLCRIVEEKSQNKVHVYIVTLCHFVLLQVLYLQQAEVTRERVYAMHQSSIDGVEDMSALAELHEAAIMHNLYQRYQKDNIYVSVKRKKSICSFHQLRPQKKYDELIDFQIYAVKLCTVKMSILIQIAALR